MSEFLPAGTYTARAIPESAQWGVSANGNEQIAIRFKIADGEHAESTVLWIGNFAAGKGTEITLETLETAGVNLDSDEPARLEGLGTVDVSIVVEHRERAEDGAVLPFVRYVNRPNRPVFKTELSDTGIASLSQRIKATRAASKTAGPAPKRGAAPAPATDENGVPLGSDGKPIF